MKHICLFYGIITSRNTIKIKDFVCFGEHCFVNNLTKHDEIKDFVRFGEHCIINYGARLTDTPPHCALHN